jgi:hypothetical protein
MPVRSQHVEHVFPQPSLNQFNAHGLDCIRQAHRLSDEHFYSSIYIALLQCRCSTRSAKLGLPLAARSVLSALRYLSTGISAPNLCEVSDGSLFYFPTRTASGDKT